MLQHVVSVKWERQEITEQDAGPDQRGGVCEGGEGGPDLSHHLHLPTQDPPL
jgi:hypothetical protein